MIRAEHIEVGIRGQRLTVRGAGPRTDGASYGTEQEIELDLTLARELHRLLGKLIPLAEKGKSGGEVVALPVADRSA